MMAAYPSINQRRDYARNDFDRTQTFVQSIVYDLPFGRASAWFFGSGFRDSRWWRISSFMTIMSGLPLYFTANSTSLLRPGNTQTPNLVAPVQILHGVALAILVLHGKLRCSAAVHSPMWGELSKWPRLFRLDAFTVQVDRFTERYGLDLRLEAFGVTNTPQFFFTTPTVHRRRTSGGHNAGSTSFGHVTSASGGRTLQLGAKFNF